MKIAKSTSSFTNGIIDYAGLFPPAELRLTDAIQNYISYKSEKYSSMVSKFICPSELFPQIEKLIPDKFPDQFKINISAICKGSDKINIFKKYLYNDLKLWNNLISGFAEKIMIDSCEFKLPGELSGINDPDLISDFITSVSEIISSEFSDSVFIFLETNPGLSLNNNFGPLINAIDIHNESKISAGFKLRTGGVKADMFPSTKQIAFCLRECIDRKVPIKFTAGLHHPIRHFDNEINTMMHGFLNIFGAGIIAMRHDISNSGIEDIINDEDPDNFIFTDEYFSWKDWKIEIDDIDYARKNLVLSFGSCSFDEPVEDLKRLNLL